jgi:predicted nucleic acid-binding protein
MLGILTQAKRAQLIPEVRPYFRQLVAAGYWIAPAIVERALRSAGE